MPLATNPKALFEIVLESDKKQTENQPVFIFHYLTGIEQINLTNLIDTLEKSKTGVDAIKNIFAATSIGMVGWRNIFNKDDVSVPFDTEKLSEIMGMEEAIELAHKVMAHRPDVEDKKKLDSPLDLDMAESAKDVKA